MGRHLVSREIIGSVVFVERDFRAGKHAHGDMGLADRSEAAADRIVEPRRHKLVANLCRSRCDVHQTVVAHGVSPLLRPKTRPPGFSTKLTEWQFQAIDPIKPSENRRRPVIFAPSYFAPALKAGRLRSATPANRIMHLIRAFV